ncbi:hypothetical protein PsorP6_013860 [Peronosclerospora sorghi]|uniref:Uncharacterized protein n=1 Tax=Peronosclerospora sorghi TaxID=230839 RepID=A0ACC0VIK0_9STRA|nr:hypothetical protein PsorP6_013860 [Peronosclerospora sorghi]
MIKRLAILLLVVLVSMTTVRADDPPETPAEEDASKEQTPPGVVLLADKDPVPSNKAQFELIVGGGVEEVVLSQLLESRTATVTRIHMQGVSAMVGATRLATGTRLDTPLWLELSIRSSIWRMVLLLRACTFCWYEMAMELCLRVSEMSEESETSKK